VQRFVALEATPRAGSDLFSVSQPTNQSVRTDSWSRERCWTWEIYCSQFTAVEGRTFKTRLYSSRRFL